MVGYASGAHAWRIRSATTGTIVTRRDVEFDETAPVRATNMDAMPVCLFLPDNWSEADIAAPDMENDDTAVTARADVPVVDKMLDAVALLPAETPPPPANTMPEPQALSAPGLAHPVAPETTHGYSLQTRTVPGTPSALAAAASTVVGAPTFTPMTVDQAIGRPDWCTQPSKTRGEALARLYAYLWRTAMDDEYHSLVENNTWLVVTLPQGARKMKGRWVYDYNRDADGKVNRCKARCVGCGYSQRAGVDYHEVWAPCHALATVRAVLAYAAAHDLELDTIDIKTAYLNAPMDVVAYVNLPDGYSGGGPDMVAKHL